MKVTNTIFAFAYASVSLASANYVGTAPSMSTPIPAVPTAQPVPVMPIPVVVADFIFSPAAPMPPAPSVATPAVTSAQPLAPAPTVGYVTSSALNIPSAPVVPVNPPAQLEPSLTASPVPAPSYRANSAHKREADQVAIQNLVSGTGAMLFNANGSSYMLVRLPVDLAKSALQGKAPLRKRATERDLIDDATTNDLNSNALLYDLLGKVFARVILPVKTNIGISNPTDDSGLSSLLKRDLVENLLGEVVASVVAPLNIVANINPDEDGNGLVPNLLGRVSATIQASPTDGNGLVPNLLGRVSATIQASPTVTAHIFNAGSSNSGLFKKDAMSNGIYTERMDDAHVAIYVPLASFVKTKGQGAISSLVSAAGSGNVQVVNMSPTPTMPMSSAPTPATATMSSENIYLRIVVPSSALF
ncbi:hypothetical protein IW152_003494 [Coemansia sp. BCRC 34962]|nr:hypothetical protein IW152_003494 [Coemansia sp. BCRC 34962]